MSSIEWTEETWNPVIGCSKVSEGCRNCYAERMSARLANMNRPDYAQIVRSNGSKALPQFNGEILELQHRLRDPLGWKRPRMVFVNSMSDLFHPGVSENLIDQVFAIMALTPQHTYQVLTKRPERALEYLAGRYKPGSICDAAIGLGLAVHRVDWLEHDSGSYERISGPQWPLPNVWIGTSVEDQETADERIPILLRTPAAIRFISAEPILDEIDLRAPISETERGVSFLERGCTDERLDWVIISGESGPGARICDLRWIRRIVSDCQAARVPVFVKQLGAKPIGCHGWPDWRRLADGLDGREVWQLDYPNGKPAARVKGNEWITFDQNGTGGENDSEREACSVRARRAAVDALIRQRWARVPLKQRKGADPAEWPADLQVREMPRPIGSPAA